MKRTIALMMTLMFAVLCCVSAQAEAKDEIRFEGIAWGSDLETVKQAMLDAGWINEGGVERFGMIEERIARVKEGKQGAGTRYPQFVQEDGHYVLDEEEGTRNAVDVPLMHSMITKEWMGVEIHNIELIFALDGDTEKLVSVTVSLMVNREDLRPEFEKLLGPADDVNDEGFETAFWLGQNDTAVLYDSTRVCFGLMNIKMIMDTARPTIVEPEPTPVPEVAGTDLLDYVRADGGYTFLGIPWDIDAETAAKTMVEQQLFPENQIRGRLWNLETNYPTAFNKLEDHWQRLFPSSYRWKCYYFMGRSMEIGKTCGGYPIESITVCFKKDGENTLFKSAVVWLADVEDGNAVREVLKERLNAICGEGTEWYGSYFWSGENETLIHLDGMEDSCSVAFAISVPEE